MISTINGHPAGILDLLRELRIVEGQAFTFPSASGDKIVVAPGDWNDILSAATARVCERGWTPCPLPPIMCIVEGCTNRSDQGTFIGDICMPCSIMPHAGRVSKYGKTFIHDLRDRLTKIASIAT